MWAKLAGKFLSIGKVVQPESIQFSESLVKVKIKDATKTTIPAENAIEISAISQSPAPGIDASLLKPYMP